MRSTLFLLALGLASSSPAVFAQAGTAPSVTVPAPGEVWLKMPDGGSYVGTVTNGVPDGKGFFRDGDGAMYEGEVRMGHRTGVAEGVYADGDRYQGEWKDGKPHGIGKMVYMLGGSYEGGWKDGKRDGTGVMVFAGSGRRAELRFANGVRVDAASTASAGPVPLDRGFAGLTPAQQQFVRNYYPALEEGDDPPYPAKGGKELFSALEAMNGRVQAEGDLWVYAAVDANGKVTSVTTAGPLDREIRRAIGAAAAMLPYTPGRCSGQPCPGVAAFHLKLVLN